MRGRSRLSPFQAGALTLALFAVACWFGFTKSNPFADPFELRAAFTTAQQMRPGSPVRIAGVQVGKVTKVEVLGEKGALVTMEIDDRGLPLHADTHAKIRPRIFLEGNYFVDLEPGSPSAPALEDGATLPITQTAAPVSLGRFLEVFRSDTREDLRTVLRELGTGFSGGGARGFGRSTPYWEPAFRDGAIVADATRGVLEHDLSGYIAHAGAVAEALDRDPRSLKDLVDGLADTADALASEERPLTRAIGVLDDTLAQGLTTFAALDAAFPPLRRLVAQLRPAVRAARPALAAQVPLLRQLRALVSPAELGGLTRELRPVVPRLVALNRRAIGLQEQVRALSSCQLQSIVPTGDATIQDAIHPAHGTVSEEGVKWLPGIAGESRNFDANGQFIKTLAQTFNYAYAIGNGRFFGTTTPLLGVNPPPRTTHPPLRPDVPCETQEPPDLRSRPADPPRAIKVRRSGPAYRAAHDKLRARALRQLRGELVRRGVLDK